MPQNAQTISLVLRAGRETTAPRTDARFVQLTDAAENIQIKVGNSDWVDLPRGGLFQLPESLTFDRIRFMSDIDQTVRVTFNAIITGRADIQGSLLIENPETLRQIELNALAREALQNVIEAALGGVESDITQEVISTSFEGLIASNEANSQGLMDGLDEALDEIRQEINGNANRFTQGQSLENITVNGEPVLLVGDDEARTKLTIYNNQNSNTIYLGSDDDLTVDNGIPVAAGFGFEWNAATQLYAISEGNSIVRLIEFLTIEGTPDNE